MTTDTQNVRVIVPLPNHYNSDMPQGHGAVRNKNRAALFFGFGNLKQNRYCFNKIICI